MIFIKSFIYNGMQHCEISVMKKIAEMFVRRRRYRRDDNEWVSGGGYKTHSHGNCEAEASRTFKTAMTLKPNKYIS